MTIDRIVHDHNETRAWGKTSSDREFSVPVSALRRGARGAHIVTYADGTEAPKPSWRAPVERRTRKPLAECHPHTNRVVITDEMRRVHRIHHEEKLSFEILGQRFSKGRSTIRQWVMVVDAEQESKRAG